MSPRYRAPACGRMHERGFTLLELLVALTVLSLLVIGLNGGIQTGLGLWRAQARQVESVADTGPAIRALRALLDGIPTAPPANADRGSPLAIAFHGTADRLDFVGDLPSGLGLTRRAEITLALKGDRLVLSWVPHRRDLAGTAQPASDVELLRRVAGLQFAYFGASAPGSPPGWLARWDAPALPALIRVQLSFPNPDNRHWPDLIVAPHLAAPTS